MDICAIGLKLYMFYFFTKIVIPFIVLVESCCGVTGYGVVERKPDYGYWVWKFDLFGLRV
jgi:hypothetical protein